MNCQCQLYRLLLMSSHAQSIDVGCRYEHWLAHRLDQHSRTQNQPPTNLHSSHGRSMPQSVDSCGASPHPPTAAAEQRSAGPAVALSIMHVPHEGEGVARVLVPLSGGVDSTLLAVLAHRCIPADEPIDLVNVCFAGARVASHPFHISLGEWKCATASGRT
jgi:hypothetical protein